MNSCMNSLNPNQKVRKEIHSFLFQKLETKERAMVEEAFDLGTEDK